MPIVFVVELVNVNPAGVPDVTFVQVPALLYCHWYGPADAVVVRFPLPVEQIVTSVG